MQELQTEVDRLAEMARRRGRLGLDTEFMPEGRYRPLLCLVQIVVGEHVEVVDPLTQTFDPTPLAEILADPAIEIVLHAGRQEWRSCAASGRRRSRTSSTRRSRPARGLARQAGYNGLLHDVLRIRLAKTASFTRWDARPLTEEQIAYARGDVEHLMPLADDIQARLKDRGRLEWAREECVAIAEATDERDPMEVLLRLPRVSRLDPKERAVAQAITAWRERTAAAEDRPVGAVLRDPTWSSWPSVSPPAAATWRRSGASRRTWCVAGRRRDLRDRGGRTVRADQARGGRPLATEAVDGPTIALAESLVRTRAQEAGLAYELIAARADLSPIVVASRRKQAEPDVRTLRGWRRELVGDELLELLAGRRTMHVGQGGRVTVTRR